MYHYFRKLGASENKIQKSASQGNLFDFLEFLIHNFPNFVINPQTNMFTDQFGALPHRRHLGLAFQRLLQVSALGIVERYDESMVVAEHLMQPLFGQVRLSGPRRNYSIYPDGNGFDGTPSSLEKIIGKPLTDYLFHANALDIELWQRVSSELTRRASYVPDFGNKLISFRTKCLQSN